MMNFLHFIFKQFKGTLLVDHTSRIQLREWLQPQLQILPDILFITRLRFIPANTLLTVQGIPFLWSNCRCGALGSTFQQWFSSNVQFGIQGN
jgi:hypothetical protein